MSDIINIEILPDGTIKTITDKISAPNHLTAESWMREAAKLAGGPVKITAKNPHTHHGHTHSHGEEQHQH